MGVQNIYLPASTSKNVGNAIVKNSNIGNTITSNSGGIAKSDSKDLDSLYVNLTNAKTNAFYASKTVDDIIEAKNAGIPIDENYVLAFRKYMGEAVRLVNLANDQITKMQNTQTIERFTAAEENSIMSDLRIYQLQLKSITDTIDQIIATINKSRLDGKLYPLKALPSSTFDQNSMIIKIANAIRIPQVTTVKISDSKPTNVNETVKNVNETIKNVNSKIQEVITTKITPIPRLDIGYITIRVSKIEMGSSECNKYASYMTTQFMPLADLYSKTLNIIGMAELDKIMNTTSEAYTDMVDGMISLQNDIIKYVGSYIDPTIDQYLGRINQLVESCKSMETELFSIYKEKYEAISKLCYATHKQNTIDSVNKVYQSVLTYYNSVDQILTNCADLNHDADVLSRGTDVQSIQSISDKIAHNLGQVTDIYVKMVDTEKLLKPYVDSYDESNAIITKTIILVDKIPKFLSDIQLYLDSVKISLGEAFDNLNIQIVRDANQVINQTELSMENSSAQFDTATMAITNIRNLSNQIYNLDSMNQYYGILMTTFGAMKDNLTVMLNQYNKLNSMPSNDTSKTLIDNSQQYLQKTQIQVNTVEGYVSEGLNLINTTKALKHGMLGDLNTINDKIAKIKSYHEQIKSVVLQVVVYQKILQDMMAYPDKQNMTNWADSIKYSDLADQARVSILSIATNINIEDGVILKLLSTNQLIEASIAKKSLDDTMTDINHTLDIFENSAIEIKILVEDVKQIMQLLEIIPKLTAIISDVDQIRQSSITLRQQTNTAYSTYDWSSISSTPTSNMMKQLDGYKDSVDLLYQNMVNIGTRQNSYIQNLLNIGKANVNFIDTSVSSLEDDLTQIDRLYAQAALIIDQETQYANTVIDSSKKIQTASDLAIDRIYQLNDLIDLATAAARKKNSTQVHTYELQANDLANLIKGAYSYNLDTSNQAKNVMNSFIRPIPSNVKTAFSSITNNMDIMGALIEYTDDLQKNWVQIYKLLNA
jgi:hypothetical protein